MKSKILGLLVIGLLAASAPKAQTTDVPQPAAKPTAAEPTAKPPKAPPGFKLSKRKDGVYLYCQEFSRIGTRFTEKICFTPDEYEEFERRNQRMRESMQKPIVCAGGDCTTG